MICKKRRQGDEWHCLLCKLRWPVDEDTPNAAVCFEMNGGKMDRHETTVPRNAHHVAARLGLLFSGGPDGLTKAEARDILNVLQLAANPDTVKSDLDREIDHLLDAFPWIPKRMV